MGGTQDTGSESSRKMTVDDSGRLVIPPDIAGELGLKTGVNVPFELDGDTLRLRWPVTSFARAVQGVSRVFLQEYATECLLELNQIASAVAKAEIQTKRQEIVQNMIALLDKAP